MTPTKPQAEAIKVIHDAILLYRAERFHGKDDQIDRVTAMIAAMKEILTGNDFDDVQPLYYLLSGYLLRLHFEYAPEAGAKIALRLLGLEEKHLERMTQVLAAASGDSID